MAGQSIERREILRILALAAGAATFPGFSKWSFACGHISSALAQIKPAVYQPLFFTAPEYAMIERLTDIIIPTDDTPGAREAGASGPSSGLPTRASLVATNCGLAAGSVSAPKQPAANNNANPAGNHLIMTYCGTLDA